MAPATGVAVRARGKGIAYDQAMPRPMHAELAERLRAAIEQDGLELGDRLPAERDLAQRLGVSRNSIREALAVLRTAGIVEPRRGDGVYLRRDLSTLNPELSVTVFAAQRQLPATMEVREALETYAARLAARRRTPGDLTELNAACDGMAEAVREGGDPAAADERFHAGVARAADNPMFEDLLRQLADPIARTRAASLARPGQAPRSLAGHRRILEAITARDEQGASAAMRDHLAVVADVAHDPALVDSGA